MISSRFVSSRRSSASARTNHYPRREEKRERDRARARGREDRGREKERLNERAYLDIRGTAGPLPRRRRVEEAPTSARARPTRRKRSEQVRDRRYTGCPGRARLLDGAAADWPAGPANRVPPARRITARRRSLRAPRRAASAKPPLSHLKVAARAVRGWHGIPRACRLGRAMPECGRVIHRGYL